MLDQLIIFEFLIKSLTEIQNKQRKDVYVSLNFSFLSFQHTLRFPLLRRCIKSVYSQGKYCFRGAHEQQQKISKTQKYQ